MTDRSEYVALRIFGDYASATSALLTTADLRRALRIAADWQSAAAASELSERAIRDLYELVPCEGVGWNEVELATKDFRILCSPVDYMDRAIIEGLDRNIAEHPIVLHVERTGEKGPVAMSDVISARALHRLAVYDECFRPMGIEDILVMPVATEQSLIGVAFTRARRDFGGRERQLLALLQPHLVAAYRNVSVRLEATRRLQALERALGDRQLAWLTPDGLLAERSALLEEWFGSLLAPPAPGRYERHDATLEVRRIQGDPPLLLLDVRRLTADRSRIEELGLTRRQGEVVSLVAQGLTDAEIARELVISVRTVAKHLENAYERLGVRNRTEAGAKLLSRT